MTELPSFWERVANTVCHLFVFWTLNCICLSFPLVFGTWYGSDCVSSWVHLFEPLEDARMTKPTKRHVRPAKTQIILGFRPVWSEPLMCAQWVAKDLNFLHAGSEDSDQTGRMPRLIWVFAGRACHSVGFTMRWLIYSMALQCLPWLLHIRRWSFFFFFFFFFFFHIFRSFKTIRLSEDTQEIPQSRSTTLPRGPKKERRGTKNKK